MIKEALEVVRGGGMGLRMRLDKTLGHTVGHALVSVFHAVELSRSRQASAVHL